MSPTIELKCSYKPTAAFRSAYDEVSMWRAVLQMGAGDLLV